MERMYTDIHVQIESGNEFFEKGAPRQMVRREFPGKGVVWFEKPVVAERELQRVGFDLATRLEAKFAAERDRATTRILEPSDF